MLNIVCVNAGNYEGKGAEYVNILFDMCRRNLSEKVKFDFTCFTDNAEDLEAGIKTRPLPENLKGWWSKLYLFKKGLFEDGDRILYFDLDTVLTGGIDEIVKYDGEFAILRDFYRSEGLQSSVMAWKANNPSLNGLWDRYERDEYPIGMKGGDQEWIETFYRAGAWRISDMLDIFQDIFSEQFVSYKVSCRNLFPKGAKVVVFHGHPRPHEILTGWVPNVWKIGGGTSLELETVCNTENDQLIKNIQASCKLDLPWLSNGHRANTEHAVIVGGGPSLKNFIPELKKRRIFGQKIFATNNTWQLLLDNGIIPDYHVMSDARQENVAFIPKQASWKTKCLYASQCHPDVFEITDFEGLPTILWHPMHQGLEEIIGPDKREYAVIGCGSTTGLKAIGIAHVLGFRQFHLYGFDSSYQDKAHHAYKQSLNDSSKVIEVMVKDRRFKTSPWMVTQVDEFKELAKVLVNEHQCEITVHGDGLLPFVADIMALPPEADTEMVEVDGVWWPSRDGECRKAAISDISDLDKILPYCKKKDLAIQAGGNVGLWSLRLAKDFKEVLTFEPDELNHRCLEKNISGQENIFPFYAALGEIPGTASLEKEPSNSGAHYIKEGADFKVVMIDSIGLLECDLIQLDIEGYELKALKGALETIRKFRPVIVIEDKGLGKRYDNDNAKEWLEDHGYMQIARFHKDSVFVSKTA